MSSSLCPIIFGLSMFFFLFFSRPSISRFNNFWYLSDFDSVKSPWVTLIVADSNPDSDSKQFDSDLDSRKIRWIRIYEDFDSRLLESDPDSDLRCPDWHITAKNWRWTGGEGRREPETRRNMHKSGLPQYSANFLQNWHLNWTFRRLDISLDIKESPGT